jgi:hypothetical protein
MRTIVTAAIAILLATTACKPDSARTAERASHDLRKAQDDVNADRDRVVTQADDVATHQAALAAASHDLGSAHQQLADARATYTTAVQARLAAVNAAVAKLQTQTDAASRDAVAGLVVRRDLLAVKLDAMASTADTGWTAYTQDVDTTFAAIERDVQRATN